MQPTFTELGVPAALVTDLAKRDITTPSPIQAATLSDALNGRDIAGKAPTGSGKTIAFGIPLVLDCNRAKPKRPRRLVLTPTRELAAQICTELRLLDSARELRIEAIYGGVSMGRQIQALRRGVDIIVACPGRLADLIAQGMIRLDGIDMVVIDEADRMADMGFLPEVRRLLDECPTDRQTLLFSATLDGDVDVLIRKYQRSPLHHEVKAAESAHDIRHHFWRVARNDRVAATAEIVDRAGATVVFCRTKHGAERVARQLEASGVSAVAIHGDRSQAQRSRALEQFQRGDANALVATDVAARGIHVDDVAVVIHFDPPADPKDYVHRSGRTGRAGRTGSVVTLVSNEVRRAVQTLQKALKLNDPITEIDLTSLEERPPTTKRTQPADTRPMRAKPAPHRDDRPRSPSGAQNRRNRDRRGNGSDRRSENSDRRSDSGYSRSDGSARQAHGQRRDGQSRDGQNRNGQGRNSQSRDGQRQTAQRGRTQSRSGNRTR